MTTPGPSFDLVIPLYNEEDGLDHLFARLDEVLGEAGSRGYGVHVILVDDGSTDATYEGLERRAEGRAEVTLCRNPANRGVGGAMKKGFGVARADYVVCYDADCTYPVGDIFRLVDGLEEFDVVSASPLLRSEDLEGVRWTRKRLTRLAAWTYRVVLGPSARGISVFTCAFRAYRRRTLLECLPESEGFPAAAEILCRFLLSGGRVVEVPSCLSDRQYGTSKMRTFSAVRGHFRVLWMALGLRIWNRRR